MAQVVDRSSRASKEVAAEVWTRGVFIELMAVIGAHKANELAARFRSDISGRFAETANREALRRDAHSVISTSSFLGFNLLSEAARNLERVCELGEPFEDDLEALTSARVNAMGALNGWFAFEAGT